MKTIVCFGDSITDNSENSSYVNEWQKLADKSWTIIGAGVSGETATEGLSRLETDVLKFNPDLVTICFGHNEVHRQIGVKEYIASLVEMVLRISKIGARVWLLTPTQIASVEVAYEYEPYLMAIREVARDLKINLVDLRNVFETTPLNQIFTFTFDYDGLVGQDYLHPNNLGHQLIARKLQAELVSHNFLRTGE